MLEPWDDLRYRFLATQVAYRGFISFFPLLFLVVWLRSAVVLLLIVILVPLIYLLDLFFVLVAGVQGLFFSGLSALASALGFPSVSPAVDVSVAPQVFASLVPIVTILIILIVVYLYISSIVREEVVEA
jgi:hypothetical protein